MEIDAVALVGNVTDVDGLGDSEAVPVTLELGVAVDVPDGLVPVLRLLVGD